MSLPRLRLYCPEGFSYCGKNHVWAFINSRCVSCEMWELIQAIFPDDEDIRSIGYSDCQLIVEGCESFGLEDFAELFRDFIALEVVTFDEKVYDPDER